MPPSLTSFFIMINLSPEQMRQVLDLTKDCDLNRHELTKAISQALLEVIETERKRCSELVRQLISLGGELKQEGLQTPNYATIWVSEDIKNGTKPDDSKLHVRSGIR